MNTKKIEVKENRLNRVKARVESYKKALAARGLDEKQIERNPTMRHVLAEARKIMHAIETLKWVPPKTVPEEKAEKPQKAAAAPKAPKPPKEKKPPKEQQAPQA